jgi:hypothetical protein
MAEADTQLKDTTKCSRTFATGKSKICGSHCIKTPASPLRALGKRSHETRIKTIS